MSDNGGHSLYRKLFHQTSVLDTLRIYLDVTDTLVDELRERRLLNVDDLETVKVCQPLPRAWKPIRIQIDGCDVTRT